jgi:hypothetical protein
MALIVGQLLFADRVGDDKVHVDVIVLDRVDSPDSPHRGTPLCFEFALPGDAQWRETMAQMLRSWADRLTVELDLIRRRGRTLVRVASGPSAVVLEERAA